MKSQLFKNIAKSQEEYLAILKHYTQLSESQETELRDVALLVDEIKCFWLARLEAIDFELIELTNTNSCSLLFGAIYLDVSEQEHYFFKMFGDYHLLSDPFLRMEYMFRAPEDKVNSFEIINYFKKVFVDAIEILSKYKKHFFILPIREIAIKDESEHYELLEKFFLGFVSSILKQEFSSKEEFLAKFNSFEEIEAGLDIYVREHLVYSEVDETKLSLREKIDRYFEMKMSCKGLLNSQPESQMFWVATFSLVSQVIEMLLISTRLNVCPYVRFEVTFNYLVLLMHTFIEDKILKGIIEKTIMFYIARKTISEKQFENIKFEDFCNLIENKRLMEKTIEKMRVQGVDICQGGIKQVQSIILNEFREVFNNFTGNPAT